MADKRELEETGLAVDYLCVVGSGKIWDVRSETSIAVNFDGIPDDRHSGATRTMRPYQSAELAGREVANDRQVSIVDCADMRAIAEDLGLPIQAIQDGTGLSIERFMAQQLGANILVRSFDSARRGLGLAAVAGKVLVFGDAFATAPAIKLTEYNKPCNQPVTQIVESMARLGLQPPLPLAELRREFKDVAAAARRGWVALVYCTGNLAVGQVLSAYSSLAMLKA